MITPPRIVRLLGIVMVYASVLLCLGRAIAASGIIEGRILNTRTGDYQSLHKFVRQYGQLAYFVSGS